MANPAITTGYAGESAGVYISAALKQAKSLEYLTTYENIKFKRTLQVMTHSSSLIKALSCNFDEQGTLALADKILTPVNMEINVQLCKKDVLADWQAAQMRAGANNSDFSSDFTAFVMSYLAGHIGQHVENNIWTGAAATPGHFEGFLTATTGIFAVDGNTVAQAKTGAFTATNIIENMNLAIDNLPATSYMKDDLYVYLGVEAYRLYIAAISTLGYVNAYNMQGDYSPLFNGVKVAVCPGMPADTIVAAQEGNLFFGTDLISDQTEIKMLDMSDLDGSDNVRVVAKFSGAVQCGIGAEIVVVS
jgi:hypothetical protein|tara:strand:+ start:17534 stop:18445 length:912 start_codon:yes stop_codon:yes gene_type:complete